MKKIFLLSLLVFVVGCQVTTSDPPADLEPTAAPLAPVESQSVDEPDTGADLKAEEEVEMSIPETFNHPHTDAAMTSLASKLNISANQIEIMKSEPKVWPDSSMGCPQDGFMYSQALVEDGMFIQLKADGKLYDYHSGGGGEPFLCEKESVD